MSAVTITRVLPPDRDTPHHTIVGTLDGALFMVPLTPDVALAALRRKTEVSAAAPRSGPPPGVTLNPEAAPSTEADVSGVRLTQAGD